MWITYCKHIFCLTGEGRLDFSAELAIDLQKEFYEAQSLAKSGPEMLYHWNVLFAEFKAHANKLTLE
jgi:hypothetical protein